MGRAHSEWWRRSVVMVAAAVLAACGGNPPPEQAGMPAGSDLGAATGGDDVLTRAEIEMIQAPTMQQLFEGRFPGVFVTPRGSYFSISIRGAGEPLVVVDGTPATNSRILSSMHPSNIERIEIIKGPQTAIYGIQGANGVVEVTTRR